MRRGQPVNKGQIVRFYIVSFVERFHCNQIAMTYSLGRRTEQCRKVYYLFFAILLINCFYEILKKFSKITYS